MGIKRFFKKIGSGVKKAGTWVKDKFHKTVNVVKKFAKPVMNVVDKVSGVLSMVPGKIGLVASGVNAANNVANKVMDQIPDGAMKQKLQAAQSKTVETANKGLDVITKATNRASDVVQRGANIANIVRGGA